MNPSNDLRLKSMIRAVNDCILPAIRDDAPLAREQAGLLMAHMAAMLEQRGLERAVDESEEALLKDLATTLLKESEGEAAIAAQTETLRSALASSRHEEIAFAVERLLANTEGSAAFKKKSAELALAFARTHTLLGRAWFKPMGFDGNPASLPAVDELLKDVSASNK